MEIVKKERNVFLCGFMATGKSSVGRRLADLMGYDFWDMDALIEAETGMSIPEIFASRGEASFRALESQMVDRLTLRTGCVVATGGGTIANRGNLQKLKSAGIVITLTADIETILERVGAAADRPMLHGTEKSERIRALLKERAPFYAEADLTIDTTSLSVEEVAREIADCLKKPELSDSPERSEPRP
jgi:shikimate kinase